MLPTFILNSKAYAFLKWMTMVVLPATGSGYFALSEIYNWTNGTQVLGTITVVSTFLGLVLGVSTKNFNASDEPYDGEVKVKWDPVTDKTIYSLELNENVGIEDIAGMKQVVFKVVSGVEVAE